VKLRRSLLVHDRNEDGTVKTYSYNKDTWAYVYHADLKPLSRPEIIEVFEITRQMISEKRRSAGRKGGRPKRQMELFDESNLIQTIKNKLQQLEQTNIVRENHRQPSRQRDYTKDQRHRGVLKKGGHNDRRNLRGSEPHLRCVQYANWRLQSGGYCDESVHHPALLFNARQFERSMESAKDQHW
jgi:hypothetical protein